MSNYKHEPVNVTMMAWAECVLRLLVVHRLALALSERTQATTYLLRPQKYATI